MKLEIIVGLWKKIVEPTRGDPEAEAEATDLFEYVIKTLRAVEREIAEAEAATRDVNAPVATTRARFIDALNEEGGEDAAQATRRDDP